jgi:hypothetical protein
MLEAFLIAGFPLEKKRSMTDYVPVATKNGPSIPLEVCSECGCCAGRAERNHPADNQERGIENSDQPQSTHTYTSGEGFIGG